jgi:hypothetical protein
MKKIAAAGFVLLLLSPAVFSREQRSALFDSSEMTIQAAKEAFSLSPFGDSWSSGPNSSPFLQAAANIDSFQASAYTLPQEPIPKRTWPAIATAFGSNILVWAFDYVLTDGQQAFINQDTMRDNLQFWFEWDPNKFGTNFFVHPFHGGLYFNSGRANGLDFWHSAMLSFGGSLTFELFFERHRPSLNDLIMTTTGGWFLGEALFRLSSHVLDDSATGVNRVLRELAGTILNPARGFTRLVNGDMTKVRSSANQLRAPLGGRIGWAGNIIGRNAEFKDTKEGGVFEMLFVYGEPFRQEAREPFDYFPFTFWLRLKEGKPYMSISGYGLLLGKEIGSSDKQKHLLGVFQHYDYLHNEAIEIGGTSFTGGLISRFDLSQKVRLTTTAHAGYMLLGASNNEYVLVDERDYNYGMGFTAKLDALLDMQKYGALLLRWSHFSIYTMEGADGHDRLNLLQASYELPIWKGIGLGLKYTHYRRNSHYVDYPDVSQYLYEARTSISYRF